MDNEPLTVARGYHEAWTTGRIEDAAALLDQALEVEVPVNDYPTRDSFVAAVAGFGAMSNATTMLSEFGSESEALLLYEMELPGLGSAFLVAEHFSVEGGLITRIRQIHDTHELRSAGFVGADA